jgi:REP element-mobilizing transposase RayT
MHEDTDVSRRDACAPLGRLHSPRSGWYSRHYLPRFDAPGLTQSVTFCLEGAIPREVLDERMDLLAILGKVVGEEEWRDRVERYLDAAQGVAHLKDARLADMVEGALLFFDGSRYRLHAWVVMPTHVHALFTPDEGRTMAGVLHSWKSFTAHEADKILRQAGRFWEPEAFDRYIRDEAHFARVVAYIENNPVMAGLCEKPEDWKWSSAWRRRE